MLFGDIETALAAVTNTRSRLAKVDALAEVLRSLAPDEIVPAVGLLTASPRQGRLGVGWRTLSSRGGSHADTPTLTVGAVDEAFSRLTGIGGTGSAAARTALLDDLAGRATASEWHLLIRIMTGELRTGALEGVLLDAVARASDRDGAAVRRAAMLSGELGETARVALTGSADDLAAVGLVVGRGVQPMLASTAASVAEALAVAGRASVEYKLDGARVQVHRHADEVRVFTRTLADVTHRVPEIVEVVRSLPVGDVILDGETLSLDDDGGPRPFQDTMARFGAEAAREIALRPWFFDVLHVDGRDLVDEPLSARLDELERVAGAWRVPATVTDDTEVAETFARDALAAGHEGVMVKGLDDPYTAGRRGKSWLKVKPVHTFDLVVLGVERGSGRRAGWFSNLHLGARDPDGRFGEPGGFVMVGKTFKGLTDEILTWQTAYFAEREVGQIPGGIRVTPDTVVEIAIDGVQRSVRYPGGVALRFARVKAYRSDKTAAEADMIDTLRSLLPGGSTPARGDEAAEG
ncbi:MULTISPECIES: ATP-dependent DNA ligase [Microbacterium]|uniref:ATP-dependent DNA ligase n=1 Tax=Microbacterium TaxID=33882 RepID=UPI00278B5AE4|nr:MULTISPECIES: ATP-dependent DNA ligase [Microbacterium]MDQ1084494.1 DNA ligase-1 [Microbacterium sp. SORGH_AS_0344]MDQ1170229.1 DNA ligase-1 [Microbacterium proteolyticum]